MTAVAAPAPVPAAAPAPGAEVLAVRQAGLALAGRQILSDVSFSIGPGQFTGHKVKAFLYNQQVTSPLTQSFIATADASGIPVVGVYETMPTPGYDYQSWMLAEVRALTRAVAGQASTPHL